MERYAAVAVRDDEFWMVTVHDIPGHGDVITDGHTRVEAYDRAIDLVAALRGHRDFVVTVDFREEGKADIGRVPHRACRCLHEKHAGLCGVTEGIGVCGCPGEIIPV